MKTDNRTHTLHFGGRDISFSLQRSKRKQLKIVVTPELRVEVYAPDTATDDQVHAAVTKKAFWITQKLEKQRTYHPLPTPRQYVSGESLVYLGRQYRLRVVKGAQKPARLLGRHLTVQVKDVSNRQVVKRAVDAWYLERVRQTISRCLEKCQAIAGRHGIPEPRLMIRNMQRRWGSCSPAGRVTINRKLVRVPVHCIEYVIMHELCHLKHNNHSRAFYGLLTRCQPDWRQRKAELDRFRLS
jgi:predicted metal-dependent hydrolase